MGFDLRIEGGRWVSRAAFADALREQQLEFELEPGIEPCAHDGELSGTFRSAALTGPARFFTRTDGLPADAPAEASAVLNRRAAEFELRISLLRERGAPELIIAASQKSLAALRVPGLSLSLSIGRGATAIDWMALWMTAAALTRCSGGVLHDPQEGVSLSGAEALAHALAAAERGESED